MSAPKNPARLTGGDWYAVRRFTTFGRKPLEERFWEKVLKTETCWLWKAGVSTDGYGKFQLDGRTRRAHAVAWELAARSVPDGHVLRHTCDNPLCVRVDHLTTGTQKDNIRDCVARGRRATSIAPERRRYGEQAARALLTNEQAAEIRRRYVPRKGVGALAREFGVSRSVLHSIAVGRTYNAGV